MREKEIRLRQIIADFEDRKIDRATATSLIHNLTGETIDIGYLSEYWASESLDTFVDKLLMEDISDWQEIDDARAIELIDEIKTNLTRDAIIIRNSTALERRYSKPEGTVANIIFHDDTKGPREILQELKKETRIFL